MCALCVGPLVSHASAMQIHCIPHMRVEDCEYVSGAVADRTIANKRMRTRIRNPRILLLESALELRSSPYVCENALTSPCCRYERTEDRVSSFDILLQQEGEHIKRTVSRILNFKPDIVIVEKSVSRIAQDMFLEAGITLILNTKTAAMERISRLTEAEILPSAGPFFALT